MPNIDEAIEALLSYQQADMDGVMVLASRQAIHEVVDSHKSLMEALVACAAPYETPPGTVEQCHQHIVAEFQRRMDKAYAALSAAKGEAGMERLVLEGKDNDGRPRQEFADRVAAMDDEVFVKYAETIIWLSAFAANNRRSDYHWQAGACYDESKRRGNPDLYSRAHQKAVGG